MSKDTGGNAFPSAHDIHAPNGMTLRDYFAAQALGEIIDNARKLLLRKDVMPSVETLAHSAYVLADAMIVEREKP